MERGEKHTESFQIQEGVIQLIGFRIHTVPSELFPQLNDLDVNGLNNLNDNSEGDENNGPDNDDDSKDDNWGSRQQWKRKGQSKRT